MDELKIINPLPEDVITICNEVLKCGSSHRLINNFVGKGSHGTVYQFPNTEIVIDLYPI